MVDAVSGQLLPWARRTHHFSFFLFLSEGGRLEGNGGKVAVCLPGNHSPAQKLTA